MQVKERHGHQIRETHERKVASTLVGAPSGGAARLIAGESADHIERAFRHLLTKAWRRGVRVMDDQRPVVRKLIRALREAKRLPPTQAQIAEERHRREIFNWGLICGGLIGAGLAAFFASPRWDWSWLFLVFVGMVFLLDFYLKP